MAYNSSSLSYSFNQTTNNQKQLVDILFPILDDGLPYNRKDSYSIRFFVNTGGDNIDVLIYIPTQTDPIYVGSINTSVLSEKIVDISSIVGITKSWQPRLIGLASEFKLSQLSIDYEARPAPLTFYREYLHGLGPNKKRIRVWPVTIDTLGQEASIVPYVDGVAQTPFIVTSSYPETFLYQFTSDIFGIDYAMTIRACNVFELYKVHDPVGVQILPIAKYFDQVGPEEFLRYGQPKRIILRILPFGTSIPYTLYFQDASVYTGTLTTVNGIEDSYEIIIPRDKAGEIVRFTLGPTAFNFHRYYATLQVIKSGYDTEMEWVRISDNYTQGQ